MGWMMDGLTIDHQMISSRHSGTHTQLVFFFTGEKFGQKPKFKIQKIQKTKKDFESFQSPQVRGGRGV
jgi:hypothetical protein